LDIGAETFSFRDVLIGASEPGAAKALFAVKTAMTGNANFPLAVLTTFVACISNATPTPFFILFFSGARWQVGDQLSATVARAAEKQKGSWGRVVL
jgi:hypothetical protein